MSLFSSAPELKWVLTATDHASSTFKSVGNNLDKTSGKFSMLGKVAKWAGIAIGAAIAGIGVAVAAGVTALLDFVKAGQQDILTSRQLALAQKNAEGATKAQTKATADLIDKMSLATGVADDELKQGLINLATTGMKVSESQKLLQVAMDVSAAKGIALGSVTTALAKAYNGTTGSLSRYGIQTKDASGKTLSFSAIVDELHKKFQGAAKAAGNVDPWKRLTNAWDIMKQDLGRKLFPLFKQFTNFIIKSVVPWVKDHLVNAFDALRSYLQDKAVPWMKRFFGVITDNKKTFEALFSDVGTLVASLGRFVSAIVGGKGGTGVVGANKKGHDSAKQFAQGLVQIANALDQITTAASTAIGWLTTAWSWMTKVNNMLPHLSVSGTWSNVFGHHAAGGFLGKTGWSVVGEHGPELVNNATGRVLTAPQTSAARGLGGNVYITVQGDSDPLGAARRIEEHLVRLSRSQGGLAFI